MRQVAGDVGLGLPPVEVTAGRLDGQGQGPAELAEPLPLQAGQRPAQARSGVRVARPRARAGALTQVGHDPLVVAQLGNDAARIVVPGAFLELESQTRQLFLEDPRTLDVVGDHGPAGPVDEEQDRAGLGAEALAEIAPRSEPGERIGPPQDHRIVTGGVKQGGDPSLFLLHVGATQSDLALAMIGGRVGQGGERVLFGPVARRLQHPIEHRREIHHLQRGNDQAAMRSIGSHVAASLFLARRPTRQLRRCRIGASAHSCERE